MAKPGLPMALRKAQRTATIVTSKMELAKASGRMALVQSAATFVA
ncbi:MAG TPA: hypothetical protein VGO69_07805 [Pyrinomonadaceae bacterium]|nr:hypothetical protein [Pyrinomonadaceae bacterium]